MYSILKNNFGLSLIETMLGAAAVIGIGITLLKMNENISRDIKGSEQKLEIVSVMKEISTNLSTNSACFNSFGGLNAKLNTGITEIKNSSGNVLFETNKIYGSSRISIKAIEITDSSPDVAVVTNGTGTTHLKITFDKGKNAATAQTITKTIRLGVTTLADDSISACKAFSSNDNSIWQRSPLNPDNIFYSNGNVGIAINDPQTTLQVNGIVTVQSLKHVWRNTNVASSGSSIAVGENITLDVSTSGYSLRLPSTATHGDIIKFLHGAGNLRNNPVRIDRGKGSDTIVGDPELYLDLNNISIDLFFFDPNGDGIGDWRLY